MADFSVNPSATLDPDEVVSVGQRAAEVAEATPAAYRERASFQVSRQKCWTVPALAEGKLYVRDESQLVCLNLRK